MSSSNLPRRATRNTSSGETSNWLLSLGTLPFLLTLVGGKLITTAIAEMGQASEEVFRGDRLPILPFPESSGQDPNP